MSIDGAGILASDLAHDVYNEILDLYDAGVPLPELRARIAEYKHSLDGDLDREIYLAACAKGFWEIGHLQAKIKSDLSRLIERRTSLVLWEPTLAKARKTVLLKLIRQIAMPRANPRPRKKYAIIQAKLFSVGDCLEFTASDEVHHGVVCRVLEYRGVCEYAILVMERCTKSTVNSFRTGKYYGHLVPSSFSQRGFFFGPFVIRAEHRMLKRANNPFRIVGRVPLDESIYTLGSLGGVSDMKDVIKEFERAERNTLGFSVDLLPLDQIIRRAEAESQV